MKSSIRDIAEANNLPVVLARAVVDGANYSFTWADNTWQAVDPVNLTTKFKAPPSGAVSVILAGVSSAGPGAYGQWGVSAHGNPTVIKGAQAAVAYTSSQPAQGFITMELTIGGLIPGASYWWDWLGFKYGGGVTVGGNLTMKILSA
jgi:hypothetical protein